jgi:two-component system vancomycin resistance associated response regulator VraR
MQICGTKEKSELKLKIALMDEYAMALQALNDNLKTFPDFEIVGAFTETDGLIKCLEKKDVDIVVVDVMIKGISGLELIERIDSIPEKNIKIIALISVSYDELVYEKAIDMGVKAFLPKDTSFRELTSCIVSVGKGNSVVPDFLVKKDLDNMFTDTEARILKMIISEYTNEKIAGELYLSRRTVESHVKTICCKLGVESRIGAVREAMKLKLV